MPEALWDVLRLPQCDLLQQGIEPLGQGHNRLPRLERKFWEEKACHHLVDINLNHLSTGPTSTSSHEFAVFSLLKEESSAPWAKTAKVEGPSSSPARRDAKPLQTEIKSPPQRLRGSCFRLLNPHQDEAFWGLQDVARQHQVAAESGGRFANAQEANT